MRDARALGERAEADGVGSAGESLPLRSPFQKIPGDGFGDFVAGLAVGGKMDDGAASGVQRVGLNMGGIHFEAIESFAGFAAEVVVADTAGDDAGIAEQMGHVGKIGGSAAELFFVGE